MAPNLHHPHADIVSNNAVYVRELISLYQVGVFRPRSTNHTSDRRAWYVRTILMLLSILPRFRRGLSHVLYVQQPAVARAICHLSDTAVPVTYGLLTHVGQKSTAAFERATQTSDTRPTWLVLSLDPRGTTRQDNRASRFKRFGKRNNPRG